MSLPVAKSREALEDAIGIWDYIAYGNPSSGDIEAADRVVDAIDRTCSHLSDFAFRKKVPERDLYWVPVEGFPQYLVLYRIREKAIEILRVFRCDLDWQRVIRDLE